ncbi:hypothetical protein KCU88_g386, partial [Aureobasidium melanogenum]
MGSSGAWADPFAVSTSCICRGSPSPADDHRSIMHNVHQMRRLVSRTVRESEAKSSESRHMWAMRIAMPVTTVRYRFAASANSGPRALVEALDEKRAARPKIPNKTVIEIRRSLTSRHNVGTWKSACGLSCRHRNPTETPLVSSPVGTPAPGSGFPGFSAMTAGDHIVCKPVGLHQTEHIFACYFCIGDMLGLGAWMNYQLRTFQSGGDFGKHWLNLEIPHMARRGNANRQGHRRQSTL